MGLLQKLECRVICLLRYNTQPRPAVFHTCPNQTWITRLDSNFLLLPLYPPIKMNRFPLEYSPACIICSLGLHM